MLQRLISLVLPTSWSPRAWRNASRIGGACLALLGAVLLVPLASAHAATTVVNEDFEDGLYTGVKDSMAVPPKIMEEGGNKFLRITGSSSDRDHMGYCGGDCPNRNRSTISFTKEASLSNLPTRWTYRADIRFVKLNPKATGVNPISVTVNNSAGYCGNRIQVFGPDSINTSKLPGHYYFDRRLHGAPGSFNVDLGAYNIFQWHTFKIDAVFSKDPQVGRINIYIDGKLKKAWTGNTHPTCGWYTPEVRIGLYGDYSTGIVDVDNIHINPTGSQPAPSVAISEPTNVRVVRGQ